MTKKIDKFGIIDLVKWQDFKKILKFINISTIPHKIILTFLHHKINIIYKTNLLSLCLKTCISFTSYKTTGDFCETSNYLTFYSWIRQFIILTRKIAYFKQKLQEHFNPQRNYWYWIWSEEECKYIFLVRSNQVETTF